MLLSRTDLLARVHSYGSQIEEEQSVFERQRRAIRARASEQCTPMITMEDLRAELIVLMLDALEQEHDFL